MTERSGRPAPWSAVALLAPAAAAVFAGTTSWAAGHSPAPVPQPVAADTVPSPASSPVSEGADLTLEQQTRTLAQVRQQVKALRVKASTLKSDEQASGDDDTDESTGPSSTSRSRAARSTKKPTATRTTQPAPVAAKPAPAKPAPVVDTTTGAS